MKWQHLYKTMAEVDAEERAQKTETEMGMVPAVGEAPRRWQPLDAEASQRVLS